MIPQDLTRQPDDTERPFWVWFADITAALLLILMCVLGFVGAGLLSNKTDSKRIIHVHHVAHGITVNTANH